jgi:transposase-like protein
MQTREQIVDEYLAGGTTYRSLGKKYGYSRTLINRWVQAYRSAVQSSILLDRAGIFPNMKKVEAEKAVAPSAELLALQKQLEAEKLRNKLLNTMIDIAEEELKIPIRKKYGTRQFKK